ncbi:hypothetical protein [Cryobacterium sp. GrIS_2_6]|uniref:hypothetical protein n=1 Tax=Cryobacterium sp. GrIS_2_6 TaxID=3162785 RepID=UPI002E003386|nr:uncharacterized protein YbjT (DUF2867 family) [Cryobacterium psychrotolerans]
MSRADVARTAVAALVDPAPHAARPYEITGPEALTLTEVAATISRIRGQDITFHDESIEEAYRSRACYGAPDWQVDAWVSTYTAIASGIMAPVSDSVEQITGTAPMNLETYVSTHTR